ncbi:MAG: alpha/beta hydrolase [Steroidobacteraceae bacterium]
MPDTAVTPVAPEWFNKAIACQPESCCVDVDGARIHYLIWNAADTHKPSLLFAHGFRAHARWWSFVAPFFLSRYRVAALDFSGMGDSGNRPSYAATQFSRDIAGVIDHANLGRTTLVGHSFGGGRVLRFCADHAEKVERAVVIDGYVPLASFERHKGPSTLQLRPKKIYPTFAAARERFRLTPEDNNTADYILDYVGRHSLKEVEGGWTWKFDESFVPRHLESDGVTAESILARVDVPVTYVYGDLSFVVIRPEAQAIVERLKHGRGPIAIPQSHHHVMLDQPLSLVAALKGILYA